MAIVYTDINEYDIFSVDFFGDYKARITYVPSSRKSGFEEINPKPKKSVSNSYDTKLENSISRSKARIRELSLCNPWDYFVTFTFDPNKVTDRHSLDDTIKALNEFLHNYNRRLPDDFKVRYLIIPEHHKDGAWHAHGLIKGIRPTDLCINQNGYLTWVQYNAKFGYISLDPIKDIEKASSYILKYVTKDLCHISVGLNKNIFYHSKGLKGKERVYRGHGVFCGEWSWEHPDGYCKICDIDLRKTDISEIFSLC